MVFSYKPVHLASQTDYDISKHSVVHIQATLPDNLSGINTEGVSLLNMIVQQCSKQIVCGSDRMEVTGKVKV